MAHRRASGELFSLIHSLTPEEKGYYRKFSKRHIHNGGNYLRLFDAICKQDEFEETSLSQKFKNYPVMKVYLKDLITDSLLLYHRNKHPHLNLFTQVQKIHVLLVKGQYQEAVRILKKALEQSRQLEVFTIERYLLRVLSEINHQHLTNPSVIKNFHKQYQKETGANWERENNLTEWELMSIEWLGEGKSTVPFDKASTHIDANSIRLRPANSTRSEIKKMNCLNYQYYLNKDQQGKYDITRNQLKLSEQYKKTGDSSFNNIYIQNNHIANSLDLNKFEAAMDLANEMVKSESKLGFYHHLAFPKSVLFRLDAYFHTGQFKEGLDLIRQSDKEMMMIASYVGDDSALKEYYLFKLSFLFANKLYKECWMDMQTVQLKRLMESQMAEYADYCMLQLMLQFEIGNLASMPNMVGKFERAFKKLNIKDFTYVALLKFFKGVNPPNSRSLAFKTAASLKDYYSKNKLPQRKAFGLLDYTNWVSNISTENF